MATPRENWPELSALLLRGLEQIGRELGAKDRELVADFIENREFEVALRWMTDAAQARGLIVSQQTSSDLRRAATLMGLEP
jgi:hypothetical protein